ncbi:hypothetical protein EI94DRAFT_1705161 [Lactarius quietus]|nr:hypothetical protein EI94DRAFT_1705161 [Lactarius quietus]
MPTSSGRPEPLEVVKGLCRTTHVSHPSRRVLDALDSECALTNPIRTRMVKCKALSDGLDTGRHVARKFAINEDSDTYGDDSISQPSTEPADDNYESIKAMADADNAAATFKPPGERTADVCVIFHRDKEYVDPSTGKTVDGNWCLICRDNPSVKNTSAFFVGGISTLRTHIAR